MFQDESIFGRINNLVKCWVFGGNERPIVAKQLVRQFKHLFGAVDPLSGDSCFRIFSHCDTVCMNVYLQELSNDFKDDYILLACDCAGWHKSKELIIPNNIEIIHIPPYTPEMNPQEQVWDEIKEKHFSNQIFSSLTDVVDRLCEAVNTLPNELLQSITYRSWMCEQLM
jgi:hypothetical protein